MGTPISMAQFASLIQKAGGKVVEFCDPSRGTHLDEAAIQSLIEEENGRSNQEEEGSIRTGCSDASAPEVPEHP